MVVVAGLPPTAPTRHYRVWVARRNRRTWVGELVVAHDGTGYLLVRAPAPLTTYDAIGLSRIGPGQPGALDLLAAAIPRAAAA
jgi:hypothetical protein